MSANPENLPKLEELLEQLGTLLERGRDLLRRIQAQTQAEEPPREEPAVPAHPDAVCARCGHRAAFHEGTEGRCGRLRCSCDAFTTRARVGAPAPTDGPPPVAPSVPHDGPGT